MSAVEQININFAVVGIHGVSLHCVVDALSYALKLIASTTKCVAYAFNCYFEGSLTFTGRLHVKIKLWISYLWG